MDTIAQDLQKEYQMWMDNELFAADELPTDLQQVLNFALMHTKPTELKCSMEQYKVITNVTPCTLSNLGKIINVLAERTPIELGFAELNSYTEFQTEMEVVTNKWYEIVSAKGKEIQDKMPRPTPPKGKANRTISMAKGGKA